VSTFRPGDVIGGRYKVLRPLGEGGFGKVLLADDLTIDRRVAIKLLLSDVPEEFALREAKAAGRMTHPNIVTVFDVGEVDGRVFIAMEYVDGKPLTEFMAPERLTLDERLRLIVQLGEGLHAAHQAGVIHRDIKPRNLIVDQNLVLKIVDFGIARTSGTGTMLGTGQIAGSLDYMAPEQLDSKEMDARTDIFAATVVAYELLSGRRAYDGGISIALRRVKNTSVPPLPDHLGPLAKTLDVAIKTGLSRERRHRFASAQKFADTFDAIRAQAESEDTIRIKDSAVLSELTELRTRSEQEAPEDTVSIAPSFGGQDKPSDISGGSSRNKFIGGAALAALAIGAMFMIGKPASEVAPPPTNAGTTDVPAPPAVGEEKAAAAPGKGAARPRPSQPAGSGDRAKPQDTPPQPGIVSEPIARAEDPKPTSDAPSGAGTTNPTGPSGAGSTATGPSAPAPPEPPPARDTSPVLEVVQAYATAHQNRSSATLKRIQPSLSAGQMAAIDRTFAENEAYDFKVVNPTVIFNGDSARVSCTVVRTLSAGGDRRTVSRPARFDLRQDASGAWLVTNYAIQQ
jgi:serine/threonine protein kinase